MAISPSNIELDSIADFTAFVHNISFIDTESPTSSVQIASIQRSVVDKGVTVSGMGTDTITISGQYVEVFPRIFDVILTPSSNIEQRSYTDLPSSLTAITKMQPHSAPSSAQVIYTVSFTDGQIATITQTVNTDWSRGKDQLIEVLSRTIW